MWFKTYVFCVIFCGAYLAGRCQTDPKSSRGMFQSSASHTGTYLPDVTYRTLGALKWKFRSGSKIFSSPIIVNETIYFGSEDGNLYAIDKQSGKQLWRFKTGGPVDSTPAIYGNISYFGSFDGYYYAVNTRTGKLIWKFKTGGERKVGFKGLWGMTPKNLYMEDQYDFYLSSPVLNENQKEVLVYFGSSDGNLYALDAYSGRMKWKYKTGGIIHSSPALYHGMVYFGSWDSYLYAVDAMSGNFRWKFKTGDQPVYHQMEGIQASPTCYNNSVYFGCRDGYFYALGASSGKQLWKIDMKGSWVLTTAAVKDGVLYISTSDSYLFIAADAKTGVEKFRFKANGYIYSSAAISGKRAYFGDFSGQLFMLNLNTGKPSAFFSTTGRIQYGEKLLKGNAIDFVSLIRSKDTTAYSTCVAVMTQLYRLGPIVSSPAISSGVVYFGSADGYLYAVNLKK
jgi:eukaryotic-like serine/threonine-protein kinase